MNDGEYLFIVYRTTEKEYEIFPWLKNADSEIGENEQFFGFTPQEAAEAEANYEHLIGKINFDEEIKALDQEKLDAARESDSEEEDEPMQVEQRSGQGSFARFADGNAQLLICRSRLRTRRPEVGSKYVPIYRQPKSTAAVVKKQTNNVPAMKSNDSVAATMIKKRKKLNDSAVPKRRNIGKSGIQQQVSMISLANRKQLKDLKKRSKLQKQEIHLPVVTVNSEPRPSSILERKIYWQENKENRQ